MEFLCRIAQVLAGFVVVVAFHIVSVACAAAVFVTALLCEFSGSHTVDFTFAEVHDCFTMVGRRMLTLCQAGGAFPGFSASMRLAVWMETGVAMPIMATLNQCFCYA